MAVFLTIGLLVAGPRFFGARTDGAIGVFGGPLDGVTKNTAAPPDYLPATLMGQLTVYAASGDSDSVPEVAGEALPLAALKDVGPGTTIIAGAKSLPNTLFQGDGVPAVAAGYFSKPADGFNWGKLHLRNAVDIAGPCGTPVVSAAEGLVIDASSDGWNSGYGTYLTIEHPNGTKTRYAHLKELHASIGDYLERGEAIGAMGDTGGATGCHLHFEVEGAPNQFVR